MLTPEFIVGTYDTLYRLSGIEQAISSSQPASQPASQTTVPNLKSSRSLYKNPETKSDSICIIHGDNFDALKSLLHRLLAKDGLIKPLMLLWTQPLCRLGDKSDAMLAKFNKESELPLWRQSRRLKFQGRGRAPTEFPALVAAGRVQASRCKCDPTPHRVQRSLEFCPSGYGAPEEPRQIISQLPPVFACGKNADSAPLRLRTVVYISSIMCANNNPMLKAILFKANQARATCRP